MSESVKIGGIGKNPAIDKINSLNSIDVKNYAVGKMEQLLLKHDSSESKEYTREIPVDFSKADWKGEDNGRKFERMQMAGNNLLEQFDIVTNPGRLEKSITRADNQEISLQIEATGDIRKFGGKQDLNIQSVGKTIAGEADLFCSFGDAENDQPLLSGKYSGAGNTIQSFGGNDGLVFIRNRGNKVR